MAASVTSFTALFFIGFMSMIGCPSVVNGQHSNRGIGRYIKPANGYTCHTISYGISLTK